MRTGGARTRNMNMSGHESRSETKREGKEERKKRDGSPHVEEYLADIQRRRRDYYRVSYSPPPEKGEDAPFSILQHATYLRRFLDVLPSSVAAQDTSRMTLMFFAVSGLDILNSLDSLSPKLKEEIVEWIYSQQITPNAEGTNTDICGFRGSSFLGVPSDAHKTPGSSYSYDCCHVAMTYTALATLLILGDDLSRVNKKAVLRGIRRLQRSDGSFISTSEGSENDMRFVYCACCCCFILNQWGYVNTQSILSYIKRSQAYDSGIAQGPYQESHGGSTYCGVASLELMGHLSGAFDWRDRQGLIRWCISRQINGFQGRPNKPVDTCYSFWVGASLELLDVYESVDKEWNRNYILSTQGDHGGFAKWTDSLPDPMHTYLGLSALSLNGEEGLQPMYAGLNITKRATSWLRQLHKREDPLA